MYERGLHTATNQKKWQRIQFIFLNPLETTSRPGSPRQIQGRGGESRREEQRWPRWAMGREHPKDLARARLKALRPNHAKVVSITPRFLNPTLVTLAVLASLARFLKVFPDLYSLSLNSSSLGASESARLNCFLHYFASIRMEDCAQISSILCCSRVVPCLLLPNLEWFFDLGLFRQFSFSFHFCDD